MDPRHWTTLELPKILDRLAGYASFSAGAELARRLEPTLDAREVRERLAVTSEARALLDTKADLTLGGAHDIRPQIKAAVRGAALPPPELLDVRDTLVAARILYRTLTRLESQFPLLAGIARRIQFCPEVIEEISRCLDERGRVVDNASPALAHIRRQVRVAHDRLQDRLQHIISSPRNAPFLQEPLITQREGRYVIPLKADFKGRIPGIVHDRSLSGATLFIEPLAVVELSNAWRELRLQEEQEVHRILVALSAAVADHARQIEQMVEALAELDLAFAKAKYAEAINASAPQLLPFQPTHPLTNHQHPGSTICLIAARHPLLDSGTVVPIDVELDQETYILVITGPNTGGKTVTLKTVGLLTLMAQAGLHIPVAPGSALSPFESVYADIGDEQSIEQSLSTFSSHLTNILSFLDQADRRSLVLLDELGAGTDPGEGSALARALLDRFRKQGATTFVATHYPELKLYAQATPGVQNACVEFDPETLAPTYRLTIGLPGRSNAFAIAQRLGLREEIVAEAREMVAPSDLRAEDLLADIHRLRLQTVAARDEAHAARAEAQQLTAELRERLAGIEEERREVLEQARVEAAEELEGLRAELRELRRRLQAAAAPLQAVAQVEAAVATLEEDLLPEPEPLPAPSPPARPVALGDTVWVKPLQAQGQVTALEGDEAEVQVGRAHARVPVTELELRALAEELELTEPLIPCGPHPSPGVELHLRGFTVEEALKQLDRHLDAASLAGLPWVRIVHGKGTGALRWAVREFLASHPLVSGYEAGKDGEGGEGVTVAKLVTG